MGRRRGNDLWDEELVVESGLDEVCTAKGGVAGGEGMDAVVDDPCVEGGGLGGS